MSWKCEFINVFIWKNAQFYKQLRKCSTRLIGLLQSPNKQSLLSIRLTSPESLSILGFGNFAHKCWSKNLHDKISTCPGTFFFNSRVFRRRNLSGARLYGEKGSNRTSMEIRTADARDNNERGPVKSSIQFTDSCEGMVNKIEHFFSTGGRKVESRACEE